MIQSINQTILTFITLYLVFPDTITFQVAKGANKNANKINLLFPLERHNKNFSNYTEFCFYRTGVVYYLQLQFWAHFVAGEYNQVYNSLQSDDINKKQNIIKVTLLKDNTTRQERMGKLYTGYENIMENIGDASYSQCFFIHHYKSEIQLA